MAVVVINMASSSNACIKEEDIRLALECSDDDDDDGCSLESDEEGENNNDEDRYYEEEDEDNISIDCDVEDTVHIDYQSDESASEDDETIVSNAETHELSKDKTEWYCNPQISGKTPTHGVLNGSVDKVILPPGKHIEEPIDLFRLYITEQIIGDIVLHTNQEAARLHRDKNKKSWKSVNAIEMDAFLGLLLTAGHMKMSHVSVERLWSKLYGPIIFRATMSYNRFKEIWRFIRFDDESTRSVRRAKDKLAPIRAVWDSVNENLRKRYMPGADVTVDAQLVGFRGRCPFKQYVPSKPAKCGMKIFWANDAATGYPLNGLPYLGKDENGARSASDLPNLGERIVEQLCAPYFGSNRNVTCDNFFTSLQLATKLKANGTTLVGALRKNKQCVPKNFLPHRSRAELSSVFGFTKNATLVSYVPKTGKAVILLSTMHHHNNNTISENQNEPEIVTFYDLTKGGTDVMDRMVNNYSCKRRTDRWPLSFFQNLLDVSGVAAYVLFRKLHPDWCNKELDKRNTFLRKLAESLVKPQISTRAQFVKSKHLKHCISEFQANDENTNDSNQPPAKRSKRSQCYLCSSKRQIFQACMTCQKNVCKEHSTIICNNCSDK